MKKYIYINLSRNYKYLKVFGPVGRIIYEEYGNIINHQQVRYRIL